MAEWIWVTKTQVPIDEGTGFRADNIKAIGAVDMVHRPYAILPLSLYRHINIRATKIGARISQIPTPSKGAIKKQGENVNAHIRQGYDGLRKPIVGKV